jgi:hypothetical protein
VIFSKPHSSTPSPPKLMQYPISAGLQAIAQMDWMISTRPIPVQRLCINVTKSGIARICRGMAPAPRNEDGAHVGPSGCDACQT